MAEFPVHIKCPKCGETYFYNIYDVGGGFSQEPNSDVPSSYEQTFKCGNCGTFWNVLLDVSYKLNKITTCERQE